MRNVTLYGLAAAAAGMLALTSCLGDGNNTQQGTMCGVIDYLPSAFVPVAYVADNMPIYSTAFSSGYNQGDCVMFYATIDYDAQTSTDYISATVSSCAKIDKWYLDTYVDTASVLPGEMTITEAGLVWNLSKGYMFVGTTHPSVSNDQTSQFQMMCNMDSLSTVEGKQVYDLWIRAQKTAAGENVTSQGTLVNAFNVNYFIERATQIARNNGEETFNFRFRYPTAFNSDSTDVTTWGSSQTLTYQIPAESTNQ